MATRMSLARVLLLMILAAGCAKRPVVFIASAPAPTRIGPPAAAGGGQRAPVGPSSGAASAPAPRPSEYKPTAALNDIGFDFDRYDLTAADTKTLDMDAAWLKDNTRTLLLIEGHADERGTDEYNLALGARRAKAAADYLEARGVKAARFNTISYGEERPRCTAHTEACWARNRWDHFLVKAE